MIDVLVAIVILGVASAAIFTSLATSHAALARSSHRTWATMIASGIVTEQDLGLEERRRGEVHLPWTGMSYRWSVEDVGTTEATETADGEERAGPAVGVSWDGQGVSGRIVIGGFVDPGRAR